MGDFLIRIHATGDHGCQRDKKHGDVLADDCGNPSCVDCKARRFLKELSSMIHDATITHWPAHLMNRPLMEANARFSEVQDDLRPGGKRRGSF